jgi:phosphoribosylamine---glycine ligase
MRTLIVGGGGREHALAWMLRNRLSREELFIAPGNAGTATIGINLDIHAADVLQIENAVSKYAIELVIIGPEIPLVKGLADRLRASSIPVVGPSAAAARLEGSKSFAKAFMSRHGIPTASYRSFSGEDLSEALLYVREEGAPIVVKASGLAAGKGAVVCDTVDEAEEAVRSMLEHKSLGDAGAELIIESFMEGEEASVFVLTDGKDYVLLPTAQDHKRIFDGDRGPNTGGMGAYAPAPVMTDALMERVCSQIVDPTLEGMRNEGYPYMGILYCGLMITAGGPSVVEFNCRLGDPEAQVVLPLIKSDPLELFMSLATQSIADYELELESGSAACVVLVSQGYPGSYEKGAVVTGINRAEAEEHTVVFHAGTTRDPDGERVLTAGGRVLAVTATGSDLNDALERAYAGVNRISFAGCYFRNDIGARGLTRLRSTL